ncbi:MAG: hypothetical protein II420_04805 [Oscillospiraceae bacterium]|nr:hypothetical protein [Oscillospiraceae bacterium]
MDVSFFVKPASAPKQVRADRLTRRACCLRKVKEDYLAAQEKRKRKKRDEKVPVFCFDDLRNSHTLSLRRSEHTGFPNDPVRSIEVTNCLSQEVRRVEDADQIQTLMEQICLIRRGKEISMPPPGSTTMSLCVSYEDGTTVVCGDDALIAGKKAYEVRYPADWSWDAFFAAPGEG